MQITGSGHWGRSLKIVVWSQGFTGSAGSRSHSGGPLSSNPQSWMGRLPAARSSSPATSRPQSGKWGGRRWASSPAPSGASLAILNPDSPRDSFQMTPLPPLPPHFPISVPLINSITHNLTAPVSSLRDSIVSPSNPLIHHLIPSPPLSLPQSPPACNCSSSACSGV